MILLGAFLDFLIAAIIMSVLASLPMIYMVLLVVVLAVKKTQLVKKFKGVYLKVTGGSTSTAFGYDESLPYRLLNRARTQS